MSEGDVIRRDKERPITQDSLVRDLFDIGLESGMIVLIHSSLSSLGWVCGGAVTVIYALLEVVRSYGTVVMPTHSGQLSDPSGWNAPPVPEHWWEEIRQTMPAFDPDLTPSRGMGIISETFRHHPEAVRSIHPHFSFAALGERNLDIVSNHSLRYGLGESSPLARLYDVDAMVLLLGVDFSVNTSFHLAEYRAHYPGKHEIMCSAPIKIEGHRRWKNFRDIEFNTEDFPEIGKGYVKHYKQEIVKGYVGNVEALLFPVRSCVDYAIKWMEGHRR